MPRKFVPVEEKKKRGTYRKDRDPDVALTRARAAAEASGAPVSDINTVEPPKDLDEEQQRIFRQVVSEMRTLGTAVAPFVRSIAHLARLEARAVEMRRNLGRKFVQRVTSPTTGEKVLRNNPALAQLQEIETQLTRLYAMHGLTPDSVAKVPKFGKVVGSMTAGAPANDPDDFDEFAK